MVLFAIEFVLIFLVLPVLAILFLCYGFYYLSQIFIQSYRSEKENKEKLSEYGINRHLKDQDPERGVVLELDENEPDDEPDQIDLLYIIDTIYPLMADKQSRTSLENTKNYLINTREEFLEKNKRILDGMTDTYKTYYDLRGKVETEKTRKILSRIEENIPLYEQACLKIYERSLEGDLLSAEISLSVFKQQLGLKGLLDENFKQK